MVVNAESAVHIWVFSRGILETCPVPPSLSGFRVAPVCSSMAFSVFLVHALREQCAWGPSANLLEGIRKVLRAI